MPQDEYGPKVKASMAFDVAVQRTYGGEFKSPVLWRGTLTLFHMGSPFQDIEATLLESKQPGQDAFVSWPQRSYESNGQTKYKNVVWMHDRAIGTAAVEAIRQATGRGPIQENVQSGVDFDPLEEMER